MRVGRILAGIGVAVGLSTAAFAQSGKVEVQWLGQAAFKITSVEGKVIMVDPWLKTNPKTPAEWKDLDKLGKVDLVLVTHGHGDHVGDTFELVKKHNIKVWSPAGLQNTFVDLGLLTGEQAPRMMSIALHLRMIGRPGRVAALEAILGRMAERGDVWFARRDAIARHWVEAMRQTRV